MIQRVWQDEPDGCFRSASAATRVLNGNWFRRIITQIRAADEDFEVGSNSLHGQQLMHKTAGKGRRKRRVKM